MSVSFSYDDHHGIFLNESAAKKVRTSQPISIPNPHECQVGYRSTCKYFVPPTKLSDQKKEKVRNVFFISILFTGCIAAVSNVDGAF